MEKGSFHTSTNHPTATLDEVVKNIPLPNQLPNGVNFRDLPPEALKSSTLESLISQNEDLMARLSVALRKANQFEEKMSLLERENLSLRAKFETVQEQYLVLFEKDKIFTNRSQKLMEENGSVRAHQQKLEKVYSELYIQAQAFQRRLQHLERYRARVHKAAPAIQLRAKRFAALQTEHSALRTNSSNLHVQTVNSYESKLSEVREELETFRAKALERDELFEQNLKLQNQLVYDQRQHQLREEDMSRELARLSDEGSDIRFQLKENLLAQESQRKEINDLKVNLPTLQEQNKALLEQVESLQALWAHKQRELETLEEKNSSLQKLNQSLSVTLNQQRKDLTALHTELDSEKFSAQDKIKLLNDEIQMLKSANPKAGA